MKSSFDFDAVARYYDGFYTSRVGKKIDEQEKAAVMQLLPGADTHPRLIEAGSGTGHWSSWFASLGYRVTGVEISGEMTDLARQKNIPGTGFIHGDFMNVDPGADYDLGLFITSLEFMPDYERALERMASLVRPGGYIITGVLNKYSYMGLSRRIRGSREPVYHSARFFSRAELCGALSRFGAAQVRASTFLVPSEKLLPCADLLERIGPVLCPGCGNFLTGRVEI